MNYKMYIFVKSKINGKNLSKGKIAGQVGHVCMRLGQYLERYGNSEWVDYIKDGEIKLIFKVDELPFEYYEIIGVSERVEWIEFPGEGINRYISTVKDNKLQEYTVMAMLTNEEVDSKEFKLL